MKKIFAVILLFFMFSFVVNAEPIEFIYSDWIDYYPEGVMEIRIESEDRYKWYKIENDERIETDEYYADLEGYEKIEESKKTYYRVINNEYIILDGNDLLVRDIDSCRKVFCYQIKVKPFIPKEEETEEVPTTTKALTPPNEEVIINPDTFDPIYMYLSFLFVCILILIALNYKKIKYNITK